MLRPAPALLLLLTACDGDTPPPPQTELPFDTLTAGEPIAFLPGPEPQRQGLPIDGKRALWGAEGERAVLIQAGGRTGGELLNLSNGAILAMLDRPREVDWPHQRLTTRPGGELFDTLVDLQTGQSRRPVVRLGEAALAPDAAVISIEGDQPVVLARSPDGRGWYGVLSPDQEELTLTSTLPTFPRGAGADHRGRPEAWIEDEGEPGDGPEADCVRWRLDEAEPRCVAVRPAQPALQRSALSGGWSAVETWSDGIRLFRDSQPTPWRPPPTTGIPADCPWKLAATVAEPPRMLAECHPDRSAPERYRALWAPGAETLSWSRALPPSERGLFRTRALQHTILAEPIPGVSPPLVMRWIDLGRRRGWRTPALLPLSSDTSPEPVLARDPESGRLALLDLEAGSLHAVLAAGEDCPFDLVELDRDGRWALLSCRSQPQPEEYVFQQLFAVMLDLEGRRAWRLEEMPEALLSGGRLLVSDREEDRAEQWVPFSRLDLLTFPP